MRKKWVVGLALVGIIGAVSMPVNISAAQQKGVVQSDTGLFVRADNSLKSERIGSLKDKAEVEIISGTSNWYKIKFEAATGERYGFVLKKFIKVNKSGTTEKKSKKTEKKADSKQTGKTETSNSSATGKKTGTATKTSDKSKSEDKGKGDTTLVKTSKTQTATGVKKTSATDAKKNEDGRDEVLTATKKSYQSVIVAAELLNVRAKNSLQSDIISTVRAYETYPIVSETKNWIKIALTSETHGYVMRDYVDFSVAEAAGAGTTDSGGGETDSGSGTVGSTEEPSVILTAKDISFTPLENKIAVLNAAAVNVRRDTNLESPIMAMLLQGVRVEATGDSENWIRVSIDDESGYIMKPYASLEDGILVNNSIPSDIYIAKTQEDIRLPESTGGTAVVEFAKQFLGNPYVWGGTSLTDGADCSGFVQSVYRYFGYNLRRTSSQQRNEGMPVSSLSEALPGDLICYDGHIGIFVGQGQGIIHASNSRSGIIITGNPSYRPIVAIRRIIN